MPGAKELHVIDGLSSVRAVGRAGQAGNARHFKPGTSRNRLPAAAERPAAGGAAQASAPSRAGRTVIPVKHDLICYECGYAFTITGTIHYTFCPKCRFKLCKDEIVIADRWTGDAKTIGDARVKPGGHVESGSITARDIVVEGNVEQATLHAVRRLELGPGACFNYDSLTFKDMLVSTGARIGIRKPLVCRDLNVEGELKANVQASGIVHIKCGGLLRGRVTAAHLVVEEGGGLLAQLKIEPQGPESESRHDRAG